jgi:hypothetical protein
MRLSKLWYNRCATSYPLRSEEAAVSQTENQYYDEFGFYSPQELTRATRRQPEKDFHTGPEVGEVVPSIVLPDQNGYLIDVAKSLGSKGGVVVFHRSAYW